MGWLTTTDLGEFRRAAEGYLRSRGAERTLLLRAAWNVRGDQPLFGWCESPDGADVRGAFLHDTPSPLLLAGGVPELAAALAPVLHQLRRPVCGVDATPGAADAFAAAWTQRTGQAARLHRHVKVYRMAGPSPSPEVLRGPVGRARLATHGDLPLLISWLRESMNETGDFSQSPDEMAEDLLCYGGAVLWEVDGHSVALGAITRPVAESVRVELVYTPHAVRHRGFAAAVTVAAGRLALASPGVREVLLISDRTSPVRRAEALGYQLASERVQLSFGPPTGPMHRLTGPLARLRR